MGTTTLPDFTRAIDQAFVTTWYDIKPDAIDNILKATPTWLALMEKGCLVSQEGGDIITETIRYDNPTATEVQKGYVFDANEPETDTMAQWPFRFVGINVVRSVFDDRANRGRYRIKDYIADRIGKARKAFPQKLESSLYNLELTDESGNKVQGLRDIMPGIVNRTLGTYGKIARPGAYAYESDGTAWAGSNTGKGTEVPDTTSSNAFWGAKYYKLSTPYELNLEADLKTFWNSIQNNQVAPDLIIMTKKLVEIFEEFAVDKTQIIKNEGSQLASLGFSSFMYKGSDIIWSPNVPTGNFFVLTTESLEIKYDPMMWFDMTQWKPVPNSDASFAQILAACNMKCKEMRRNGRAYSTDTDT